MCNWNARQGEESEGNREKDLKIMASNTLNWMKSINF